MVQTWGRAAWPADGSISVRALVDTVDMLIVDLFRSWYRG
jgi:hypothetical protein